MNSVKGHKLYQWKFVINIKFLKRILNEWFNCNFVLEKKFKRSIAHLSKCNFIMLKGFRICKILRIAFIMVNLLFELGRTNSFKFLSGKITFVSSIIYWIF